MTARRSALLGLCLLVPLAPAGQPDGEPTPQPAPPPNTAEALPAFPAAYQTAIAARDAGNFEDAAQKFAALAARNPKHAGTAFNLAYCVHASGDYERAVPLLTKAAAFPQARAVALYNLGCAHARLGQADPAFAALRRAALAGTRDLERYRADEDLASLRGDATPAWDELLADIEGMIERAPETALRFWVGEWDVYSAKTGALSGRNTLTLRNQKTVIHEQWKGLPEGSSVGESWNHYRPSDGTWVQTWVDGSGAVTRFVGRWRDGAVRFDGVALDALGNESHHRMVVRPLESGYVRQTGSSLGRNGETWTTQYDLVYVPKGEPYEPDPEL